MSARSYPEANVRNYLERKVLRDILAKIPMQLVNATEIGCGFGRLTMTLTEFAHETVGFERDPKLAKIASTLLTGVRVDNVESLFNLPVEDDYFSFAMTFTVLQHIVDEDAERIVTEIKRITGPISYVLLVEETTVPLYGVLPDEPEIFTIGRSIDTYSNWMEPYQLIRAVERIIEPTYTRKDVGHYMLFASPSAADAKP